MTLLVLMCRKTDIFKSNMASVSEIMESKVLNVARNQMTLHVIRNPEFAWAITANKNDQAGFICWLDNAGAATPPSIHSGGVWAHQLIHAIVTKLKSGLVAQPRLAGSLNSSEWRCVWRKIINQSIDVITNRWAFSSMLPFGGNIFQ